MREMLVLAMTSVATVRTYVHPSVYANVTSVKEFMWFVCANIIAFYGLFEIIYFPQTPRLKDGKYIRETISSNLERQLENNIEKSMLVMKSLFCNL